jgi:hypothetical protein
VLCGRLEEGNADVRKLVQVATAILSLFSTTPASAVEVNVRDDPQKPNIEYSTPEVFVLGGDILTDDQMSWYVDTLKDRKSGNVRSLLAVFVTYRDYHGRHYETALLKGGEILHAKRVKSSVASCNGSKCNYLEVIVIDLPTPLMKASASTGVSIQLIGDTPASKIIDVSADHIASINKAAGIW